MSPSWETIDAPLHIFLMLANPLHRLTFTEVSPRVASQLACSSTPCAAAARGLGPAGSQLPLCVQLPVYRPDEKERADPELYAANVRQCMVRATLLLLTLVSIPVLQTRQLWVLAAGGERPEALLSHTGGQACAAQADQG